MQYTSVKGKARENTSGPIVHDFPQDYKRPPKPLSPLFPENIPTELRAVPRWVNWRWEWNAKKGEWDKPPVNGQGRKADPLDPETWQAFDAALGAVRARRADGVGFVFVDVGDRHSVKRGDGRIVIDLPGGDAYSGSDFDDCIDDAGALAPWAQAYVDQLATYTERSPSGHGVKCFHRGAFPHSGNAGGAEQYTHGRYFTVTGDHLEGTPRAVEDRADVLSTINAQLFPPTEEAPRPSRASSTIGTTLADADLLELARNAKGGEKFARLFDHGDTSEYGGDDSKADGALSLFLAFWTNRDAARMDHLHRLSALFRPKWDEVHYATGETYGERTIATAIAKTPEGYTPPGPAPVSTSKADQLAEAIAAARSGQDDITLGADVAARLDRLEGLLAEVLEENKRLREENTRLCEERTKILAVQTNGKIKPERGTALAATFHYASAVSRGQVDEEGFTRVSLPALAERAGVSPRRVSDHLSNLAEWGILEKRVNRDFDRKVDRTTGEIREGLFTELWVKLAAPVPETLDRLATIDPERPQTWGGKRVRCPDHPEAGVIKTWTCAECGKLLKKQTIAPADDDLDDQADAGECEDKMTEQPEACGLFDCEDKMTSQPAPEADHGADTTSTPTSVGDHGRTNCPDTRPAGGARCSCGAKATHAARGALWCDLHSQWFADRVPIDGSPPPRPPDSGLFDDAGGGA